jgi:hypothetical protein
MGRPPYCCVRAAPEELIDNSLDAARMPYAPEVTIAIERPTLSVADNGARLDAGAGREVVRPVAAHIDQGSFRESRFEVVRATLCP